MDIVSKKSCIKFMYPNLPFNAFPFTREGWSTEYFLNSSKMEGHQVSFGKELLENSSLL